MVTKHLYRVVVVLISVVVMLLFPQLLSANKPASEFHIGPQSNVYRAVSAVATVQYGTKLPANFALLLLAKNDDHERAGLLIPVTNDEFAMHTFVVKNHGHPDILLFGEKFYSKFLRRKNLQRILINQSSDTCKVELQYHPPKLDQCTDDIPLAITLGVVDALRHGRPILYVRESNLRKIMPHNSSPSTPKTAI